MRNKWIILGIFVVFSCKAQQVLPLNNSAFRSPTNSYFKDINHEFDYYLGIWKATFQDKTITLHISKEVKIPFEMWNKNFYRDQLRVRYEIMNKSGVILESSLNKDFTNDISLSIKGLKTQSNGALLNLIFAGGNCSVGVGAINFKKIDATQFSWGYYPGTTTRIDTLCPPDKEYKIYLPETENLIFTKQ
ncbi:DUF6705 family protein [Chryseobacterium jejuense]|uniref:DUF6705 domain-containing protein n=1 Tax=Chryseobacterium jejuense TaxID=445960 RepID=A0A2X2V6H9_CHRJE|nr:DUF6705 family protein [Chryseobacterium jejuense]SDJ75489.1 hypothetical protein SAMN05421542_4328 [Chryseobacterium jejuense]SQB26342.1 Uncharacterised protein [Chryseobacterium jejuense]